MTTREEKIDKLAMDDIDMIQRWIHTDTEFLYAVLVGDGWIPYNQLTDEEVDLEYEERFGGGE